MAKKSKPIKFNTNKNYIITPKSKNLTFEYTGTIDYTFLIDVGFTLPSGKQIYGYKEKYQNFAVKSGNNLVLTTLFTKDSGKSKTVTTTIKNYFSDNAKDYNVIFDSYKYYYDLGNDIDTFTIKPNATEGTKGLFKVMSEDTEDEDFILGTKGNDTITITAGGGDWTYDTKGNDTYNNEASDVAYMYDLSGSETYNTTTQSTTYSCDYKGNDKYFLEDDGSFLAAEDYAGNDTYKINSIRGASSADFWINDYKGNDNYSVVSNSGEYSRFNDTKGNDEYYATEAKLTVVDKGGKDYYELKQITSFDNSDTGKGNDTYRITDCANLSYDDFDIGNSYGNENYTFTNVWFNYEKYYTAIDNGDYAIEDGNGNDKYTFDNSKYITVKDSKGNDSYTAKNGSRNIYIDDGLGNDKYSFTDNYYQSYIYDRKGNDKYKFAISSIEGGYYETSVYDYAGKDSYTILGVKDNGTRCISLHDESLTSKDKYSITYADGFNTYDYGGNDKYTIKNSWGWIKDKGKSKDTYNLIGVKLLSIEDEGGNDKYTISDMVEANGIVIDDKGGKKDSLILSGISKNNIVVMANVNEGNGYKDNSLILFNKSNNSYVYINNYFTRATDGYISGFGDGKIETMKAGKKSISVDYNFINNVREAVTAYLPENKSVLDVLQSKNEADIQNLVTCFTKNN